MARVVILAASLAFAQAAGIYPNDHWDYSLKLRSENDLKSAVDKAVNGDHTLIVRWIASEG